MRINGYVLKNRDIWQAVKSLRTEASHGRWHGMIRKLDESLKEGPRSYVIFIGSLLISLMGYIDYSTGSEITITFLYLLPITFVTWYAGWHVGTLIIHHNCLRLVPGRFIGDKTILTSDCPLLEQRGHAHDVPHFRIYLICA